MQAQMKIQELEQQHQIQHQQQQLILPNIPSFSSLTVLDDNALKILDTDIGEAAISEQSIPSTSTSGGGPCALQNVLKPHLMRFIPTKKEPGQPQEQTENVQQSQVPEIIGDMSQVEVMNLPQPGSENIVFVPKNVGAGGKKALVLIPQPAKKISNKRSNPGKSVPKEN